MKSSNAFLPIKLVNWL